MSFDRRTFLNACTRAGIASPLLPGILYTLAAQAQEAAPAASSSAGPAVGPAANPGASANGGGEAKAPTLPKITPEMIDRAAELAGVGTIHRRSEEEMLLVGGLNYDQRDAYAQTCALKIENNVPPAYIFHPGAPAKPAESRVAFEGTTPQLVFNEAESGREPQAPANLEDLAFASLLEMARLIWQRKITSVALTQMYIDRLKRYDQKLHFVITLLEDRAMAQAKAADEDLENGLYRGPLHGIPWGAKDLLAVKDYPTTWGAGGFEQQIFNEDATVVQRLDKAGAVLVAKTTLGALAMGDKWFGGRTRNPWNPTQGSSGSSAGSASSTAAGCVAFAIGSETLGSISSPSTRCGTTGLRPTFGFVPRTGAMALSWTMDKLGPICRSVEDCALILDVIHGPDGKDLSAAASADFNWNPDFEWRNLRIGYFKGDFDPLPPLQLKDAAPNETPEETKKREDANAAAQDDYTRRTYDKKYEQAALDKLTKMGAAPGVSSCRSCRGKRWFRC